VRVMDCHHTIVQRLFITLDENCRCKRTQSDFLIAASDNTLNGAWLELLFYTITVSYESENVTSNSIYGVEPKIGIN
jgi:hypothetical protein